MRDKPLSPEEWADKIVWNAATDWTDAQALIAGAIREAMDQARRERDAEWKAALADSCDFCCLAAAGNAEWYECTSGDCPLRALVGEPTASAPKAPPEE